MKIYDFLHKITFGVWDTLISKNDIEGLSIILIIAGVLILVRALVVSSHIVTEINIKKYKGLFLIFTFITILLINIGAFYSILFFSNVTVCYVLFIIFMTIMVIIGISYAANEGNNLIHPVNKLVLYLIEDIILPHIENKKSYTKLLKNTNEHIYNYRNRCKI